MKQEVIARGVSLVLMAGALLPISSWAGQPGDLAYAKAAQAIVTAEQVATGLDAKVCLAVVDASGVLEAFKRMDGAAPGCVNSAIDKARAAAMYRTPTYKFMARVNNGEPALLALPGMVALGGGVPAQAADGSWVGAVGVAGTANPNEVKIATAAAASLGSK